MSKLSQEEVEKLPFVLLRCNMAGCHYGYMYEEGEMSGEFFKVTLLQSRRIWSWAGAHTLSDLAMNGSTNPKDCQVSLPIEGKHILAACEIIRCSEKGKASLQGIQIW